MTFADSLWVVAMTFVIISFAIEDFFPKMLMIGIGFVLLLYYRTVDRREYLNRRQEIVLEAQRYHLVLENLQKLEKEVKTLQNEIKKTRIKSNA